MVSTQDNDTFSLPRRLKRHVWARQHRFFAHVSPGLEQICVQELEYIKADNITVSSGRVEFQGKLDLLYRTNLEIRTADRIYFIVDRFRATCLEDVFNKVRKISWPLLLYPTVRREYKTYFKNAFLTSEALLVRTIESALEKAFLELPADYAGAQPEEYSQKVQTIIISVEGKLFQIGLDTSGKPLHKRGYRHQPGLAPMRETLAAGILQHTSWTRKKPLIDAMTGSGTLAIEAALLALREPVGQWSTFTFMDWPSFRNSRWQHILKMSFKNRCSVLAPIMAIDIDNSQLNKARNNARQAGVSSRIQFLNQDFFSVKPRLLSVDMGYLMMNTPYGKRLTKGKLRSFYYQLGSHLKKNYKGWHVALIYPAQGLENALGIPRAKYMTFTSGGTKIRLLTAKIK
ncbi:class I SAM-dependent RNA methyltransferase [candidate division CSSED10-310 bacterium]|uniref:Class I SAM-dependent RNA methyltransferase n=1 Tax=candidate division CSSED10-310 bacterium TaxID=2855610 RepID=A0ABV6Z123_UNCC1